MSVQRYPGPEQYGPPQGWQSPGPVPLRPMPVGEILGLGWGVVRRSFVPLVVAAVAVAALSAAVTIGTLAVTGSLRSYADAAWVDDVLRGGATTVPSGILVATFLGLVVSTSGGPVIAGLAAAVAGAQALGHHGRGAVAERLAGRWPMLLGTAVIVGVLVTGGLVVLIVPGVLAYLILVFAGPAVVMERGSIGDALRRSATLTRGHRGRILGAAAVTLIAGAVASAIVSSLAGYVVGGTSPVTALLVTQVVAVLVGGIAGAWTGAVFALLYIDVRIRTEQLDRALWAAAERSRVSPPDLTAG